MTTRRAHRQAALIALHLAVLAILLAACSTTPPAPTARPSLSPLPLPNPAWSELTLRIQEGLALEGGFVEFVADASAGDIDLASTVVSIGLWADNEAAWLAEHPPEDCFADAHAEYLEGVNAIADVADAYGAIAAASLPPSEAEAREAAGHFETARTAMESAVALARADVATCRE